MTTAAHPTTLPAAPVAADRRDTAFLGHPVGLGYLAFTEAWERFSYYGMQALLVLYMSAQLLQPGHVEHIGGFTRFRATLESVYGPLSITALASAIFGLYASTVYLTPIFGGLLADRVLGRRRTVILGSVLMTTGHFMMAFEASFLGALLCLALGAGCLKGNIAAQIGALYAPSDLRRADAFQIFYLGINAGVILAPIVCGTLGEKVGWDWGFSAAGIGMSIGLLIYLAGQRYLPPDAPLVRGGPRDAGASATLATSTTSATAISTTSTTSATATSAITEPAERPRLLPGQGATIAVLLGLLPVLALTVLVNMQIFNAYLLWGQRTYDFTFFGHVLPTSWLVTLDSVVSVSFLFLSLAFWRVWSRRHAEPDEITKIVIGAVLSVGGGAVLYAAAARFQATGLPISLGWAVAFHVVNSAAFANIFPVALALYARAAPPALASTIVGIFYLHLFAANALVGWIGGYLDKMPGTRFWALHIGIALAALVLLVTARAVFRRQLSPSMSAG